MWSYLAANYGLGILWGGLLGITFQFVLNTETMRYTLAWGRVLLLISQAECFDPTLVHHFYFYSIKMAEDLT